MLSLTSPGLSRNCQGFTRRDFLRVGALGLGGLALPSLLAARASAAPGQPVNDKSVVLLFLQGGPSQIELFDPKMSAPQENRSITGEVQTTLPGITFGGTFPKLAALADKFTVVRSFASGNADHQNYLSVAGGGNALKASMGCLYSRAIGTNNPRTGMPTNCLIKPEAVVPGLKLGTNFETKALEALASGGMLGDAFSPFDPSGGGDLKKNLELKLPREQFDDRRALLNQIDTFKRQIESTKALDGVSAFERQAYDVIVRGVSEAFDLSKEEVKTLEKYDTSKLFKLEEVIKWGDMRRSSNLLGKQLLMARRLCERGCGFVTVTDAGWDMHSNGNSPKNLEGIKWLGNQVDHAVAAFIEDVTARGLSDKIMLIVTGEMGRTPKINKNGGRDHWANLTPLLVFGGGLKMGQVIGQSDKQAGTPATEKYTPLNLLATVMNVLFDVGEVRVNRDIPKNVAQIITDGKAIPGL